jgi:hypothetical protein
VAGLVFDGDGEPLDLASLCLIAIEVSINKALNSLFDKRKTKFRITLRASSNSVFKIASYSSTQT